MHLKRGLPQVNHMKSKSNFVSVIIPVLSLNSYIIDENLPAHDQMNQKNFEVIVLPNELPNNARTLLKKYPWLKIIPTHTFTRPAQKRNIGAEHASGDILAFIDDDAYPTPEWIPAALNYFDTLQVDAVCGPGILPPQTNIWERIFDEVLKSPIGSGGFEYRVTPMKARYVDDYPSMNLLIRADVFKKLGGFDNDYWPGEDSKLAEDLIYRNNGKMYYSPDVVIYHHRRQDLFGYLKQHGKYGFHRGVFFAHGDANSRKIQYTIPSAFCIYVLSLLFLHTFLLFSSQELLLNYAWVSTLPLALYIILLFALFTRVFRSTSSLQISFGSAIVLFLMHCTYGFQFIHGFVYGLRHTTIHYGT